MSNYPNKQKATIAVENRSKFDLSQHNITTSNFFRPKVVYSREMVPGDSFNGHVEVFTRVSPLAVPTFGDIQVHNRVFFVPYRTIMKDWQSFIDGTPNDENEIIEEIPQYSDADFRNLFLESITTSTPLIVETDDNGDVNFEIYDSEDEEYVNTRYVFTETGKRIYDILLGLGYNINFLESTWADSTVGQYYSLLPLYAFFKIFADWYLAKPYNTYYSKLLENASAITSTDFLELFTLCAYTAYTPDRFTQVWDTPNGDDTFASGITDQIKFYDEAYNFYHTTADTKNNLVVSGSATETPELTHVVSGSVVDINGIDEQSLHILESVTNYFKRNQIAGMRDWDRYFLRYGKKLDSTIFKRSLYLGADSSHINISDVMSNSATDYTSLGDYAGKGIGYGNSGFDFDTNEFGQFIVISSIVPLTGYYQGVNSELLRHRRRVDFFTPEFDNLGVQAITKSEVFNSLGNQSDLFHYSDLAVLYKQDDIFGFVPTYEEYKVTNNDVLSGDFRLFSRNTLLRGYHLFRDLGVTGFNYDDLEFDLNHSAQFNQGADYAQFERIFNAQNDASDIITYDPFIQIFRVDNHASRPMLSLTESLLDCLSDDDNKKTSVPLNGTQVN